MLDFVYQHHKVRDLGQDWQAMVTRGWQDPPDLAAASQQLVAGTSAPVLAAYRAEAGLLPTASLITVPLVI